MESPPKRITRARAAAKTTDGGFKIATAASKAKFTRSASTTKRKTRADDNADEAGDIEVVEEVIEPKKPARGRPKKIVTDAPAETTKATRGKAAQPEPEEADEPTSKSTRARAKKPAETIEPSKTTRGRAKKIEKAEEAIVAEEPPKRATRGRVAAVSQTVPKKTVTFEEPDKENIVPVTAKGKAATGIIAKPVRKPATTRATRGKAKSTDDNAEKPTPLSPKKATQVATAKESASEDELATSEKTPIKPLMRSPVKLPGSVFSSAKKLDFAQSTIVNRAEDMRGSIMGSPARRPPSTPFKDAIKASQDTQPSETLLRSPIRMALPTPKTANTEPTLKASLLQSPAKRPTSPITNDEPTETSHNLLRATPKAATFKISRFATPRTISRPGQMGPPSTSKVHKTSDDMAMPPPSLNFSGRLSTIVPRDADFALSAMSPLQEISAREQAIALEAPEPMLLDDVHTVTVDEPAEEVIEPQASEQAAYKLREEDESPFLDSDSEDELASPTPLGFAKDFSSVPATPRPFEPIAQTPQTNTKQSLAEERSARREKLGFTPLARQLTNWMATSPEKSDDVEDTARIPNTLAQASPIKNTFFDDEMTVRDEMMQPVREESSILPEDPNFDNVELDDEDLALAHEADELSLVEPDQTNMITNAGDAIDCNQISEETADAHEEVAEHVDPAPSEASQEYGDENVIPIDPALLATTESTNTFATPKRILRERVFHTVSKVPLKGAAEETPMRSSPMKRSLSISKLPVARPTGSLTRNNTVISYSPSKRVVKAEEPDVTMEDTVTPSKTDALWSTLGTPARTPRRDLNPALLKGAIVFVDVHTTEGADASCLFTELLTQMGARCIKSWSWTGNGEDSKVGITHVVFKDGGKRTLEKARETGGVVQCVGVGWVLE